MNGNGHFLSVEWPPGSLRKTQGIVNQKCLNPFGSGKTLSRARIFPEKTIISDSTLWPSSSQFNSSDHWLKKRRRRESLSDARGRDRELFEHFSPSRNAGPTATYTTKNDPFSHSRTSRRWKITQIPTTARPRIVIAYLYEWKREIAEESCNDCKYCARSAKLAGGLTA